MRILLIEDDIDTSLTIKELLEYSYVVEVANSGEEGEYLAKINTYDLIILDYILPDTNGIIVCTNLRKSGIKTPIIMVTGQFEIQKKVAALDAGVDDYLTKPFNFDELLARIRAILRRQADNLRSSLLEIDDLTFDTVKKIVKRRGEIINLRRKELYLLEYLMTNPGRTITRTMIFDHVWDSSNESLTNTIDVHIKYLRDVVDRPFDKKLIKTVHGLGYKIEA